MIQISDKYSDFYILWKPKSVKFNWFLLGCSLFTFISIISSSCLVSWLSLMFEFSSLVCDGSLINDILLVVLENLDLLGIFFTVSCSDNFYYLLRVKMQLSLFLYSKLKAIIWRFTFWYYRKSLCRNPTFIVTPSWNVRNCGHLCFWDDFYYPIHKVIKPVF